MRYICVLNEGSNKIIAQAKSVLVSLDGGQATRTAIGYTKQVERIRLASNRVPLNGQQGHRKTGRYDPPGCCSRSVDTYKERF